MTPEGQIEAYLKLRVQQTGGQYRKLEWIGRRGAPDRFIFWPGPVFAFVEVKTPKGVVSRLQEREMGLLMKAGFNVAVVRSKEDVDTVVLALTPGVSCT